MSEPKLPTDVLHCRAPSGTYWIGTRAQWVAANGGMAYRDWKVSRIVPKGPLRAAVHAFLTAEHDHCVIQTSESLRAKVNARIAMAVAAGYSEEQAPEPRQPAPQEPPLPSNGFKPGSGVELCAATLGGMRCSLSPGHHPLHKLLYPDGRLVEWTDRPETLVPRKP